MSEKKRVLHIEDEPDLQNYVAVIIGKQVEIVNAASLKEAYKLLDNDTFDLILLDLTLPDGSGIDVLTKLNSIEGIIPPVVIFSVHEVTDSLPHVSEVLVKGRFNDENLLKTVTILLGIEL